MFIPSIIGIFLGLIGGLRLPLPKWRLLGGLVALSMILTGTELLSAFPQRLTFWPILWISLGGGALIGSGMGYFARGFWMKNRERTSERLTNNAQRASPSDGEKPSN